MSEEKKAEETGKLLADIKQELRDIKFIQQAMGRNFNAVVVMIIFGVLIALVNMFLGDYIGREINRLLEQTEVGQQAVEQVEKTFGGQ